MFRTALRTGRLSANRRQCGFSKKAGTRTVELTVDGDVLGVLQAVFVGQGALVLSRAVARDSHQGVAVRALHRFRPALEMGAKKKTTENKAEYSGRPCPQREHRCIKHEVA